MAETASAKEMGSKEVGSIRALLKHKRAVILTVAITIRCSLYYFFYYVAALVCVTFIASMLMPDLRKHGYLDGTGRVGKICDGARNAHPQMSRAE